MILIHEGKGHYIGSVVIVHCVETNGGKRLIRETLNRMGLGGEEVKITQVHKHLEDKSEINFVIYADDGDY